MTPGMKGFLSFNFRASIYFHKDITTNNTKTNNINVTKVRSIFQNQ